MQRTAIAQIDKIEAPQPERRRVWRWPEVGDAGAEHAAASRVAAVLVVDIVGPIGGLQRRRRIGDRAVRFERPAIEVPRPPTDAVQTPIVGVVHDRSDMIGKSKHLGRLHGHRIDAIDDRPAVGPILGQRHPDVCAVVVKATGVIQRPFPKPHTGNQVPGEIDLEEVAGALAGVAVESVNGAGETPGRRGDFHRGNKERVADLDHALRVVGREPNGNRPHLMPLAVAGQQADAFGNAGSGRARRGAQDDGAHQQDGAGAHH